MVHLRCVVHLSSSNILRRGGVEDVGVFVKPMAKFKIPQGGLEKPSISENQ